MCCDYALKMEVRKKLLKELILMIIMMVMMRQIMGVVTMMRRRLLMTISCKSKTLTMMMKIIMTLGMRKKDADKDHVR